MLPNASAYVKSYDGEIRWVNFLTGDDDLLKKYTDIWIKDSNGIKANFIANPSRLKSF